MSAGYSDATDSQSYMMPTDLNGGIYDGGTSSESSASSPLNGYEQMYGGNQFMPYPPFPMQYPTSGHCPPPQGLVLVELDVEGLYEDYDRRRRKDGSEKIVASHVHSRRRAQNRASQRAFRDRKEKNMRELEQRLRELEVRHDDLTRSHESLELEYSSVKAELEKLRKENATLAGSSSSHSQNHRGWNESKSDMDDPLFFDVSTFCYDREEGDDQHCK